MRLHGGMDAVFDDVQAAVAGHLGNGLTPVLRHGGAGRVVQAGGAVDKLGIKGLGRALQGGGHHALRVGLDANELQAHGPRQRL